MQNRQFKTTGTFRMYPAENLVQHLPRRHQLNFPLKLHGLGVMMLPGISDVVCEKCANGSNTCTGRSLIKPCYVWAYVNVCLGSYSRNLASLLATVKDCEADAYLPSYEHIKIKVHSIYLHEVLYL